jgi:hypothetical protein
MNPKEMIMKRSTTADTFAIAAITAVALGIAPTAKADNKGCSAITMKGTFAYTGKGTVTDPAPADIQGPIVEVGTQTFDGNGGTTSTAMISAGGMLIPLTITGTYTVNPDCTGTMTLQVAPFNATVHVFFVIDDTETGFQAMETDPGDLITRTGRRQYPVGDWRQ